MVVRIVVVDERDDARPDEGELASVLDWLRRERIPTLRAHAVHAPVTDGEMGAVLDALTLVASGGTGAAVVAALDGWLRTRRPSVRLKVTDERGEREIEVSGSRPGQADAALERFLDATLPPRDASDPA